MAPLTLTDARAELRAMVDDLRRQGERLKRVGIDVDVKLRFDVDLKDADTSELIDEYQAADILGVHPAIAAGNYEKPGLRRAASGLT